MADQTGDCRWNPGSSTEARRRRGVPWGSPLRRTTIHQPPSPIPIVIAASKWLPRNRPADQPFSYAPAPPPPQFASGSGVGLPLTGSLSDHGVRRGSSACAILCPSNAGLPSPLGRLVRREWSELGRRLPWVSVDALVVMPDHFHGILWIVRQAVPATTPQPNGPPAGGIGAAVGQLKSRVTKAAVGAGLWPTGERLWQRGYHDRMLRSEQAVVRARVYIANNPISWERDHGFVPMGGRP